MALLKDCVCGHSVEIHRHYRSGSDCAACGSQDCPRFRRRAFRPLSWGGGRRRARG